MGREAVKLTTAIIAAAGRGTRMRSPVNKVFLPLSGRMGLEYTIEAFAACSAVDNLIVVGAAEDREKIIGLLKKMGLAKPWRVVTGGLERQDSIHNALQLVAEDTDIVVVHDGARPLVTPLVIEQVIAAARLYQAAGVAVPVKDTIKIVDDEGFVDTTPPRDRLWAMQTPQAFSAPLLKAAYAQAQQENIVATDDAALVERLGVKVKLIAGSYSNIKITTQEDLIMAAALIAGRKEMRIGIGYDVHKFAAGRDLVLGGVIIPYSYGLAGHSDADVLLHAIADALLGAAALGDIGLHFPDTDPCYRGISSLKLLAAVKDKVQACGYGINNIDSIIVAEQPKLAPYILAMRQNIADVLDIDVNQVSVKATTTEGLGFVGNKEGIAAYAVASLYKV